MPRTDNTSGQEASVHPISERVAELNEQIQDLAQLNLQYRTKAVRTQLDRSAHQMRELRLLQIKEELGLLLKKYM